MSPRRPLAFVAVVTILAFFLPQSPSYAVSCEDQKHWIWTQSTQDKQYTRGMQMKILLRDAALDANCTGPERIATVHVKKGDWGSAEADTYIEVGWVKRIGAGGEHFVVYWSGPINGDPYWDVIVAHNLEPGTYDYWRIGNAQRSDGTWDWTGHVDFINPSGWAEIKSFNRTWGHGYSFGETEGKGDGTGMYDERREWKIKNDSGTWVDNPNHKCVRDTSAAEWVKISARAYDVKEGVYSVCA